MEYRWVSYAFPCSIRLVQRLEIGEARTDDSIRKEHFSCRPQTKIDSSLAPQQVNSSIVALGEMAIAAEQETIALCDGKGHIA
jgi:hypothetical protein